MIRVKKLSKRYGNTWALRNLTLEIEAGDMFGLIGPNGAGKTTLIKILATLLEPTSGGAWVDRIPVAYRGSIVASRIGYLPDFFGVYEDMRVREYLDFFGSAYGLRNPKRKAIMDGVLELTDLTGKRNAIIGTLSRGMQQRLGLARVLVHDPKVLLLDEPASGLDPRARIEIRALLKELQRMGKTILISSHILADLSDLCNKIGLIEKGKLLYAGSLKDAMARVQSADTWILEVADETERALKILQGHPAVREARMGGNQLVCTLDGAEDPQVVVQAIMEAGLLLRGFKREELTLEDAFLRLTKGEVA